MSEDSQPFYSIAVAGPVIEQAKSIGFTSCLLRVYSSRHDDLNLDLVNGFLSKATSERAFVSACDQADETKISRFKMNFEINKGSLITRSVQFVDILSGSYLSLLVPFSGESRLIRAFSQQCRAYLNTILGEATLLEMQYEAIIDLATNENYFESFRNSVAPKIGILSRSDFMSVFDQEIKLDFKPRALELIDVALSQDDPTMRFLQLWFAVEAQIGDGDGRAKFCDSLKSASINAYLKKMFQQRNACIHEGQAKKHVYFDEYFLLSCIRLHSIDNEDVRTRLVARVENAMSAPVLPDDSGDISVMVHVR